MGTDAKAFIIHNDQYRKVPFERHYDVFGLLTETNRSDYSPVFAPKGMLPRWHDMAPYTGYCRSIAIVRGPDGYELSIEDQLALTCGYSIARRDQTGRITHIAYPGCHGATWLTRDELERVIQECDEKGVDASELVGIYNAMQPDDTFVFWLVN